MLTEESRKEFYKALLFQQICKGAAPTKTDKQLTILKAAWLDTPIGPVIAISNDHVLYLLEFVDRRGLEKEIGRLRLKLQAAIIPGYADPIASIERELKAYFEGVITSFKTPFQALGTPFQRSAWQSLLQIPYGQTRSYLELTHSIGQQKAYRAVANANGANQLAIMIPCHRVINSNGNLGGYGGGLARKKWLIEHERKYAKQ